MAQDRNRQILGYAVRQGWIDHQRASACYQELKRGGEQSAEDLLVAKGLIDSNQAHTLREMAARAGKKRRIGDYEVVRTLGSGAMGTVYLARQRRMNRTVALKVLSREYARDEQYIQRFLLEAKACGRLKHENVVTGIDVGQHEGIYYFAQEFIEGTSVDDILYERGPIDEASALRITLKVCRALDHIREHDLVHRDIKPENILITTAGEVKLCDFGLAKDLTTSAALTAAGTSVGTPHYISPEQARGERDVDIRADVYSLGVSLYHMLVGQPPFDEGTPYEIMVAHIEQAFPPIHKRVEVSDETAALIDRMCAKDAAKRPDPGALLATLERMVSESPVLPEHIGKGVIKTRRRPSTKGRRRAERGRRPQAPESGNGQKLLLGGGLLALLLFANLFFFRERLFGSSEPKPVEVTDLTTSSSHSSSPRSVASRSPEASSSPTAADPADAALAALEAERAAATTPAQQLALAERFSDLAARYPSREGGRAAAKRADALRAAADGAIEAQLAGPLGKAKQLQSQGRQHDALQALAGIVLAEALAARPPGKALTALRGQLDAEMKARYAQLEAAAQAALAGEQISATKEAAQALAAVERFGDPTMRQAARALIGKLEARGVELTQLAARQQVERWDRAFVEQVLPLWRTRKFAEAVSKLDALAADSAWEGVLERVKADRAHTAQLQTTWQEVVETAGQKRGRITVVDLPATVSSVKDGVLSLRVTVRRKTVKAELPISELPLDDVVRWLPTHLARPSGAEALALAGLLRYAEGLLSGQGSALVQLRKAAGLGAPVQALLRRAEAEVGGGAEARDAAARAEWQAMMGKLSDTPPLTGLTRIRRFLARHGDTAYARARTIDVAKLISSLQDKLAGVSGKVDPGPAKEHKLAVKQKKQRDGSVELGYRLRSGKEAEDWELGDGWALGRRGGLFAKGRGAVRWKPLFDGDFDLSLEWNASDGASNLAFELDGGDKHGLRVVLAILSAEPEWANYKEHHLLQSIEGGEAAVIDRTRHPKRLTKSKDHTLRIRRVDRRVWVELDGDPILTGTLAKATPVKLKLFHFNRSTTYPLAIKSMTFRGSLVPPEE